MNKFIFNNTAYVIHPKYDLYAGSADGMVINIVKKQPMKGYKNNTGYMICMVREHGQPGQKTYCVHRFVYECFNGIIPEGKAIDHINNKRDDNRLCNLQLLTQQENSKKGDHSQ